MWFVKTIDVLEGLKTLKDESVDLVITSPPYADVSGLNYGGVETIKSLDYVDWFLDIMKEIKRVIKPSGSFILNINDFTKNGYRDNYIYRLIGRSNESGLKFYDTYFWVKKCLVPNGGQKRFRTATEFIFHFVKDRKSLKFYMDRVLQEPSETTKKRYTYEIAYPDSVENGKRTYRQKTRVKFDREGVEGESSDKKISYLVRPTNVFSFRNNSNGSRENEIKHPAPFHPDLPYYFINLLTDRGDLVVDPFSGIGTTGVVCVENERDYIGFDLNETYVDYSKKRIEKYQIYKNIIK